MAAQTRRVLVPRLDDRFEEPFIDVAILEGFQKLGYDRPTLEQAQAVRSFILGSDVFVMLPTGSGKSLCYASLLYTFDGLQQMIHVATYAHLLERWPRQAAIITFHRPKNPALSYQTDFP